MIGISSWLRWQKTRTVNILAVDVAVDVDDYDKKNSLVEEEDNELNYYSSTALLTIEEMTMMNDLAAIVSIAAADVIVEVTNHYVE